MRAAGGNVWPDIVATEHGDGTVTLSTYVPEVGTYAVSGYVGHEAEMRAALIAYIEGDIGTKHPDSTRTVH